MPSEQMIGATGTETDLEKAEGNFDRHNCGHRLSVWSGCRLATPRLHRSHGVFVKTHPDALDHPDVADFSIKANDAFHYDRALVFYLARFIGIFRWRLVETRRNSHSIQPGAEDSASRAAALAGSQTAARPAADTGAIAISKRIGDALGQRITEVRHIGAGNFQVRRAEEGGVHRQLGVQVLNLCLGRCELRPLELGELPL